jgi:hypothetical protein
MDNVEVFESAIEAMHKVKELINLIDSMAEKVYLAYCEYDARWYVTDDDYDLGKAIHERWGGDGDPENERNSWKVWEYSSAKNKDRFPNIHRNSKRSVIRSDIPMIRRERSIGCEYSVEFNIE